MVEQISTSISTQQKPKKWFDIMSSLKSLFHKDKKDGDSAAQTTKFFNLTRKDAIVSMVVAVLIIAWAVLYWKKVYDNYNNMNNDTESLKNLQTYNVNIQNDKRFPSYSGENATTISSMISIYDNIQEEIEAYETFEIDQKDYYEVLLKNLYLPSINVWKDPYTKNFDLTVLWQKYLDVDEFQDETLMQTWSDFILYMWNDADYNEIENITIWDKVVLEDNPNYFYIPISVDFVSPNKRSFLLLVNKLSITSNQNNISLLNEFFYYLLKTIKSSKKSAIDKLMQEYRSEFSSSTDPQWSGSISDLTWNQEKKYMDMVIGYNLYHRVKGDGKVPDSKLLLDDSIIVQTIKQAASCDVSGKETNQDCFYDFRDKYRSIPYLAYGIGMEKQANRTSWLLNFLRDLSPAIAITHFEFERYSSSDFLDNEEKYKGRVSFNAYWRNVTLAELDEAASLLWILCFWKDANKKISADEALTRINEYVVSLWEARKFSNVSVWELKGLLENIKNEYEGLSNYDKMIKLFEIWRMLNDADLCIQ